MPALQRLLVALDDSPTARRALSFALNLNRQYGGELVLCTVLDHAAAINAAATPDGIFPSAQAIVDAYDEAAKSLLAEASSRAHAAGARSSTVRLEGRAAAAILSYVNQASVDAIVLGTQGKRGLQRFFLGSTAEGVLRLADVPVFIVPGSSEPYDVATESEIERILVAIDESDPSDAAFDFALELAAFGGGHLLCCSVVETHDLFDRAAAYGYDPTPMLADMHRSAADLIEAKTGPATDRDVAADSLVVEAQLPGALLEAAASNRADLIAIGTHGRRGLRRLLLGSVAENVIRRSVLPVVAVRRG